MIPFITSRVNYSAISEADNKADRDRQLQLKVSDEKRRRMKEILNENLVLRLNSQKNKIAEDYTPILHTLKDSFLKPDEKESNFSSLQLDQSLPIIELNTVGATELSNIDKSAIDNANPSISLSHSEDNFESEQVSKFPASYKDMDLCLTPLKSFAQDLGKIISNIKTKENPEQTFLVFENIEKNMKENIADSVISKQLDKNDLNDLSYQLDFLEGYLQSQSHSTDTHNKLIDSINKSRSYVTQIESNELAKKESNSINIENNPLLLENVLAMMSPPVLNSSSTANKTAVDSAINKNNQVNGTARFQQKNKDETLPLIVLRSI